MQFYRPLPKVKAISFDLDDTLYDNHPVIVNAEKGLRDLLAADYPQAAKLDHQAIMTIKRQVIEQDIRLASDMGEQRKQVLRVMLQNDVHSEQELTTAVSRCFAVFYDLRSKFQINKTIHSCLATLADKVPLVAITNGNVDVTAIGLDWYFQFSLHASLEYAKKPYPDMFTETTKRLNIPPQHILHVGDGLVNDVFGGYQAGFSTAWFAINRHMDLANEKVKVLPNIQLYSLDELALLV